MNEPYLERPASRGSWLAWPLLALTALPMVVMLVVARRVLTGDSQLYGDLPGDLAVRERAGLLLQVAGSDSTLLVPLLGLAALVLLAHRPVEHQPSRAPLWCGAALAALAALIAAAQCALVGYLAVEDPASGSDFGFFGPRESLLELFGPRTAATLLLAALAGGLAVLLAALARRPAAVEDALLDGEPAEAEPASPEPEPAPEPVDLPDADPHARYRRPG